MHAGTCLMCRCILAVHKHHCTSCVLIADLDHADLRHFLADMKCQSEIVDDKSSNILFWHHAVFSAAALVQFLHFLPDKTSGHTPADSTHASLPFNPVYLVSFR